MAIFLSLSIFGFRSLFLRNEIAVSGSCPLGMLYYVRLTNNTEERIRRKLLLPRCDHDFMYFSVKTGSLFLLDKKQKVDALKKLE